MKQFWKTTVLVLLAVGLLGVSWSFANTEAAKGIVEDFSDFFLDILEGPIAKLLAAFILITGVVNIFQGKMGVAVGCGGAFLLLMFLPKLIEVFK